MGTTENDGWFWWASSDGERFTVGPEPSREAVIKAAIEDGLEGTIHIIEARQDPIDFSRFVDGDRIVEDMLDRIDEDNAGEEDGTELEQADADALARALEETVKRWQTERNIRVVPFWFNSQRNAEMVTLPIEGGAHDEA